ncbi:MAG TPA: zinc ribbon domain-containing protein [Solirubrobacteraceae bacterium]|nr:zinc ribbon domain-containing protein [Solirubrobacteraceae bacterium]
MSGLKRRIRRPGAADDSRPDENPLSEPAAASGLSAGVDPDEVARGPTARRRGGLRRRLRYLRRAREVMLRDLGGLVYEMSRRAQEDARDLVTAKVQRLAAVDAELHELETELGPARRETVLREPGIGGTCAACGELHPSDARFCARCGTALHADATPDPPAAADATPDPPPAAVSEPQSREDPAHSNGRQAGAAAAAEPVPAPSHDLPS